jgi:hypothetical protein
MEKKRNAAAHIPTADILVKCPTTRKEVREVGNLRHVPLIHVGAVLLQVGVIPVAEKLTDGSL